LVPDSFKQRSASLPHVKASSAAKPRDYPAVRGRSQWNVIAVYLVFRRADRRSYHKMGKQFGGL
jgi:hypothetical protein